MIVAQMRRLLWGSALGEEKVQPFVRLWRDHKNYISFSYLIVSNRSIAFPMHIYIWSNCNGNCSDFFVARNRSHAESNILTIALYRVAWVAGLILACMWLTRFQFSFGSAWGANGCWRNESLDQQLLEEYCSSIHEQHFNKLSDILGHKRQPWIRGRRSRLI